jgi:hypothetical protein
MKNMEQPIYVVGIAPDKVVTDTKTPRSVNAFGTLEEAENFAREDAKQNQRNLSRYEVARYDFSGEANEVRP